MINQRSARRRVGDVVRQIVTLVPMLWAVTGFATAPIGSRILFAGGSRVPPAVQAFAWQVIETRCNYQRYEREQRSFWAYDVRIRRTGTDVIYSINILSDLAWEKTDPPAIIEMTVVDDWGVRLTTLRSSLVLCGS